MHSCKSVLVSGTVCGLPEQYSTQIYVSASRGVSNESCWEEGESLPCDSLSLALVGAQRVSNSVAVVIEPGDYGLSAVSSTSALILNSVSNFGIIGTGGEKGSVRVNCEPGTGVMFNQSREIAIENVVFNGCGINASSLNFEIDILSAIHFILCEDVIISWTSVLNSKGTAMVVYNSGGKIDILNSTFSSTTASGVYIEFPSSTLSSGINTENASYVMSDCTFKGNRGAYYFQDTPATGGGLTLKFGGESWKNRITVRSCVFEDNIAYEGAGMFIQFNERSRENSVTIDSTRVTSNLAGNSDSKAGIRSSGGGAKVIFKSENAMGNSIVFQNCSFHNNSAYLGGGISVSAYTSHCDNSSVDAVNLPILCLKKTMLVMGQQWTSIKESCV